MKILDIRIGSRLGLSFLTLIVLMGAILAVGLLRLQDVAAQTQAMMERPLAKERLVSDWYRTIHTSVRRTTAVVKSSDPSLAAFFAPENKAATLETNETQKRFEALLDNPEEKAAFADLMVSRQAYIKARDAITAAKAAGQPV